MTEADPARISIAVAQMMAAPIKAKLDRLSGKLGRMEPVRPIDVKIAIEAGRDALALIEDLILGFDQPGFWPPSRPATNATSEPERVLKQEDEDES